MSILIFDHPFSPYAQKCKISLHEKGVPFETRMPGAIGTGQQEGDFLSANPRGEVPALIDDGFAIFDSSIILEYIEDKWPAPPMMPASPADRAKARMIEEVMDTQYEAINWGLSELTWFKRAEGAEADALRARAKEQLGNLNAYLTRELGGREWFNGATFGWADLVVIPYLNGSMGHGVGPDPQSELGQWQARANGRASVQKCIEEIRKMTEMAAMPAVADAVKAGLFKREYRDHRLEWMLRSGGERIVRDGMANGSIRFSNEIR